MRPRLPSQPPRRAWPALGVAALLLTTCTGAPAVTTPAAATGTPPAGREASPIAAPAPRGTPPAVPSLRAGAPAAPASAAPASPTDTAAVEQPSPDEPPGVDLPDAVELITPDVVVRAGSDTALPVDAPDVAAAAGHVAQASALALTATAAGGEPVDLEVLVIEVTSFRPLTPDVTAQNVGVWERLVDGDVVVRHDVAQRLGLELGGMLTLQTSDGDEVPVRVGAFAANGAPPLADLLVERDLGARLGAGVIDTLIVGGADTAPDTLAADLAERLGVTAVPVRPPAPQQAPARRSGSVTLEAFSYTSRGDGTIAIDQAWVARNIVPVEIPGMGTTRCHRVMAPQLTAALRDVAAAGLYDHLQPRQFGGCFAPRHILFDPRRGLSMHAWGLAIDFNVRDNGYGATPRMDRRIVEIFEAWGFAWGGHWRTPDGMHFELERVVEVP